MFEVELDIFSGRPNPRWTLDGREEAELIERLLDRTVPIVAPSDSDGHLGYRGFIVRASGATAGELTARGLPSTFRVRDGLGQSIDMGAESWLLYTAPEGQVPGFAADNAAATLSTPAGALRRCRPYFTSTTDFTEWNGSHQGSNNCYNYASNFISDTFAQPGKGTGQQYSSITVQQIHDAAARDGYTDNCTGRRVNLFVGFCIIPGGGDYHWYRRTEPEGGQTRWCHKPGGTQARNYDSDGQRITDPSTCNRGPYTIWGGFMFFKGKQNTVVR
jgi:hypothetical protein